MRSGRGGVQRSNIQGGVILTVLSNTNNDNILESFVFGLHENAPKLK